MRKSQVSSPILTTPTGRWMESQESCSEHIFLIPSTRALDLNRLYQKTCLTSDYLHNVEVRRWWFTVPLIYKKDCLRVKADCGEQLRK